MKHSKSWSEVRNRSTNEKDLDPEQQKENTERIATTDQSGEPGSAGSAGESPAGRWVIYLVIIILASASNVYRIFHVNAVDSKDRKIKNTEGSPLLCANDRSRWCTIRALGDLGCFEIDEVIADPKTGEFSFDKRKYRRYWATIDLVKHRDAKGEMHFYSSKPTLFPVMLAYLYKGVKLVTGKSLSEDTFYVVRLMLVLVNVVPLIIFLLVFAATMELVASRTFTKVILVLGASSGTFMTPFGVTLNNHLPAAFCVGLAVFSLISLLSRERASGWHFINIGLCSAFAAANELPALSFFCFIGGILLLLDWKRTLILFLPAALIVIAAFFVTNRIAHSDWIPPYAHRNDGKVITDVSDEVFEQVRNLNVSDELIQILDEYRDVIGFEISAASSTIHRGQMPLGKRQAERFVLTGVDDAQRLAIVRTKEGRNQIRIWNNWYEYPESRWLLGKKGGVDKGEPLPSVYAFHCLIGHHGLFSLTPMWFLTLASFPFLLGSKWKQYRWFSLMTLVVSVVVIGFYLSRPLEDRNYGGGTSGLRWLIWLAPLWLVSAAAFVDWISKTIWGKITVTILVVSSIASAYYSSMNPWVHPWLYEFLVHLKWIKPF